MVNRLKYSYRLGIKCCFLFYVQFCGLALLIVGAWALSGEKSLIVISQQSNDKFTGVPILLVVLGVFIILLAGVGVVGSLFNKTKWGRVLLIVVSQGR